MEYTTSATEIKRRKVAFLSLSISLIVGTYLSSALYHFSVPLFVYGALLTSLLLLGAFSFTFFGKIATLKVRISAHSLQRTANYCLEAYPLSKMKRVQIKWTTNKTIREIYIWMNDGSSVFLTGLQNFERFRTDLLAKLDSRVIIHEWREPINFDSVMFYPLLGLLISNLSILAFRSLIGLSHHQIQFGMKLFGGYLFIFGLYFFLAAPISKRSGNTTRQQDYILGILMLVSGIWMLLG